MILGRRYAYLPKQTLLGCYALFRVMEQRTQGGYSICEHYTVLTLSVFYTFPPFSETISKSKMALCHLKVHSISK